MKTLITLILLHCSVVSRAAEFAVPLAGKHFEFPRDHGSHPEFRTEWWYLTGHLDGEHGERFGFQVTFFRQAGVLPDEQLFLAHCALLDVTTGKFINEERLNRDGWDASSSTQRLDVRNGNWSLRMDEDQTIHVESTIHADAELIFELKAAKPLVMFGKDGVSRKGASASAASHYLSFPRLSGGGTVRLGATKHSLKATAWMDHEFSSSQLDAGQIGWDWAALQLNDGREIMVYRMRRSDGSSDPAGSTLAWIDPAGVVKHTDQFRWLVEKTWTSPRTQAHYPIQARIEVEEQSFVLRPLVADQELGSAVSGLPYWEGACDVLDAKGTVLGRAFLELAGYVGDLATHLHPTK